MTKQSTAGHTELLVGLKWHPRSINGAHNGAIYYEKFLGHAYAVAMQPHYVTDEQWKFCAESIVTAVNTYPAVNELVEALEKAEQLYQLGILNAPDGLPDEVRRLRQAAITHYRELAGTSNEGAKS